MTDGFRWAATRSSFSLALLLRLAFDRSFPAQNVWFTKGGRARTRKMGAISPYYRTSQRNKANSSGSRPNDRFPYSPRTNAFPPCGINVMNRPKCAFAKCCITYFCHSLIVDFIYKLYLLTISSSFVPPSCILRRVAALTALMTDDRMAL